MDLFQRKAGIEKEETLEGILDRLVFSGSGGEFTVARLKVEGAREPITVVGSLLGVPVGAHLRLRGYYETNPRFGRQFRVLAFSEITPSTRNGITRYLGAGLIKGIGPEFAKRIVARFGEKTLEILDTHPHRILEVEGIGKARAKAIQTTWIAQRGQREVMVFLQGYGVSPALAARIYKRYGSHAVTRVRENPFRLAFDVWGIGFLSADRLAQALGIGKDSDSRLQAGVRYVLEESGNHGHVYLPREQLIAEAARRLEVDPEKIPPAIEQLAREGAIAIEHVSAGEAVYDANLLRAERAAASGFQRLIRFSSPALGIDPSKAISRYEQDAGIALAPQQAEAIRQALSTSLLVITGGPGVGKTTLVRGIVAAFLGAKKRVALAAPTGRAAKRLAESTGQPAATLHRLLEWRPAENCFGRNRETPLETDLLVVDEASMMDVRLCADLLSALAQGTRFVIVGDQDQLPSVGPGMVLRDIIQSGAVPVVRLHEIFRQAARSLIVENAHRILKGEMPSFGIPPIDGPQFDTRDFFFIEEDDAHRAADLICELVTTRLPRRYGFSPSEIQVLTPMHRGELGASNLNQVLQAALIPGTEGVHQGDRMFKIGDRVMQIRNNYDKNVYNGDMGKILRREEDELVIQFDERELRYELGELDELTLAYAVTIHKSQGSEYPAVVIPVHTQHFLLLQRGVIYTAVTRGKKLVVLVGMRKALSLALKNAEVASRFSRLAERVART